MTLTDTDLQAMKELMNLSFKETAEEMKLVTKDDIKHLPNKDEFYKQTSEILKRLDNLEEEKDILSHQVSTQSDKLKKIQEQIGSTTD